MVSIRNTTWVFASALFVVATLCVSGCEGIDGTPILKWEDAKTGLVVTVGSQKRADNMKCYMEVVRNGQRDRQVIASRTDMHHVTLLRYGDWLLVLSGDYVLGGYDMANEKIATMESPSLPFTQHTTSGEALVSVRLDDGEDTPPIGFVGRNDR